MWIFDLIRLKKTSGKWIWDLCCSLMRPNRDVNVMPWGLLRSHISWIATPMAIEQSILCRNLLHFATPTKSKTETKQWFYSANWVLCNVLCFWSNWWNIFALAGAAMSLISCKLSQFPSSPCRWPLSGVALFFSCPNGQTHIPSPLQQRQNWIPNLASWTCFPSPSLSPSFHNLSFILNQNCWLVSNAILFLFKRDCEVQ